ncbi:MAG: hypothetical protein J6563_03020 [Gilliamella sp.]|uniref:hypothetical protein n=1 Tax=Gilliamella sp. TaxID=1891236 RepID=UPI0026051C40|nr:hypothetical protein [Gilliamella sp.]MCO6551934.1 hypothetical protein [Gilliamella sp.]
MKKIKYSLLLACSLTLVGCFEPSSIERWIDNPTNNEIKVTIDGNELTIPAKSGINYTFKYGKHTLSYNNEDFNFVAKPAQYFSESGFINPTQSNYFIHTLIYSESDLGEGEYEEMLKKDKEFNNIEVIIDGDEMEVELPLKLINDVFIEKIDNYWNYSYDEPFPETVTQKSDKSQPHYERLRKIYRESDFIDFLKENINWKEVSFHYRPKKFSEIEQYVIPDIDLNSIKCKEGRQYLEGLLNDWNHLLTLKGSDFTKPYNELVSEDAIDKDYKTESLCTKENDPEQTYSKALRQFTDAIQNTRNANFYVIK